jgi:general transcription factor 3C polypeptide 4
VISLADGSFHVVRNFSTDPSLTYGPSENGPSSDTVSRTARSVFVKVKEDKTSKMDVNAIHGMDSYDNDAFYIWIHESVPYLRFK